MGELFLFLILFYGLGVLLQVVLYKTNVNGDIKKLIYVLNVIYGIMASVIVYTGYPSNDIVGRVISALVGLLCIVSIACKNKKIGRIAVPNLVLTVSILTSFILMNV